MTLDTQSDSARSGTGSGSMLENLRRTIWLSRADLRACYSHDPEGFDWWLFAHGRHEYPTLGRLMTPTPGDWFHRPAADIPALIAPPLTRFMQVIWSQRPDLRQLFDLTQSAGQEGYLWWYFLQGPIDYDLACCFTTEQKAFLNKPLGDREDVPIPLVLARIQQGRADLQQLYPLETTDGRIGLLNWYLRNGLVELNLVDGIDRALAELMFRPCALATGLPLLLSVLWHGDPALRARYPAPTTAALLDWACREGAPAMPAIARLLAVAAPQGAVERRETATRPRILRPGVNLIGYARAEFGIGEDVRMAALALRSAGIDFSIHSLRPGQEVSQQDDSAASFIDETLPFGINLFCMTAFDTALLHAKEAAFIFEGRTGIGFWPWELEDFPQEWKHVFGLVDEVWASSRHCYGAYRNVSTRPLRQMPMAVTVDASAGMGRADFGLPSDRLLFVFAFDTLSSLARKNPIGCVRAFRLAFPQGTEPATLVIKTMRTIMNADAWAAVADEIGSDPRIIVIDDTLRRGAVLDLYRACDIFVSLHRAEGFGRGLVEAMLLGRPVIATGYSGNMDFTIPATAALVDYDLRPVLEGEYTHAAGDRWAEPDLDHAAWQMRRLAADYDYRSSLASNAQILASRAYSPEAVGRRYRTELARLGLGAQ